MKTLYLLRHTRAWGLEPGGSDKARCLTEAGEREAADLALYLRAAMPFPETVLCSTAERARATLAHLERALGRPLPAQYRDDLYETSAAGLMAVIGVLDDRQQAALVIGHNPALEILARLLTGGGEARARARLDRGLPPGGLIKLALRMENWADLQPGCGEILAFVTPEPVASPG